MAQYPDKESKSLEFKEKCPDFSKLIRTCVAFSNTSGGDLIIGVKDQNQEIVGLDEAEIRKIYEDFSTSLYDAVSPVIIPSIYIKNIGEKEVVGIKIWPGNKKPYFIKRLGIPKGVMVRVGASTRPANDETVEELSREGHNRYYDNETVNYDKEIFSKDLLEDYFGNSTPRQWLAEKIVKVDSIDPEKYNPTIAGVLFFCEQPDFYTPEATVLCTIFKGDSGREIIQSIELKGPLPALADSVLKQVSTWIESHWRQSLSQLKGVHPVPLIAVREAVINALIHRKYSTPSPIKIAVYEQHLEIFSPGQFPGLVSLEHLGDGTTYLRNPTLANLARKKKMVEKMGSGIRVMQEECRRAHLPAPQFFEDGDHVKVIFRWDSKSEFPPSNKTAFAHLHLLDERGRLTPSSLGKELGASRSTVTRRLNALVKEGILERFGKGIGTYYELVAKETSDQ